SLFSYYNSDKIVLAISKARPVEKKEFPYLYNIVDELCIAAGLPQPKKYVIDDTALNAFATGRDPEHSVICVTTGLLQTLKRDELEGVIAHELSHIKNYDIRLMTITVVFVGLSTLLSDLILRSVFWGRNRRDMDKAGIILLVIGVILAILSPIIATIIKLAISREREYLADASGALMTRYPEGLANALEKISKDKEPLEAANNATAHLYIDDPFKDRKGIAKFMVSMFATHPPIEDRIKRLRGM
ncbi:MAG: M48 family metallopeptidase, partial [Candidatus Diapherotrites archaeon]|nr:M48 family metallopeptidase [Candidatus Diapherotrites archaeon]